MSSGSGHPSWWDPYSNQPHKLSGRSKPRLSVANLREYAAVAGTALALSPAIAWRYAAARPAPCEIPAQRFAGLSLSPDERLAPAIEEMVDELGVEELLIRVPSWDRERIDAAGEFAERFAQRRLMFSILQCRDSVAQPRHWAEALDRIFSRFKHLSATFQIGNAVNRTKWGCANSGEYLGLLETAERVRARHEGVALVGSSVIDFEPLVALRTLANRRRYRLDAVSALLYVNRRGSPFQRQYGVFDLHNKLRLLHAIVATGSRNAPRLWITEFNWPLLDTRPYTPNSGHPSRTVDEPTQARYLTEYYRIAWRCGWVEKAYWWELINPGYGLVDHRGGGLRKMPSYYAFKALLEGGLSQPPAPAHQT